MSKQDFRLTYFYRFKLGEGAVQTAHSINVVWDGGSIGECTVQRWFQKFSLGHFISQTRKVAAGLLLRRKKLDTWAPHELTRSQDHVCLEICNSLLFTTKMNCFLRKSLSVAGQGWSTKIFRETKPAAEKGNGDSAGSIGGVIHYSFLNAGKPIKAEEYCQGIEKLHRALQEVTLSSSG